MTEQVIRRFVERINAHDVDGLTALLTEDHRLVDALGVETVEVCLSVCLFGARGANVA